MGGLQNLDRPLKIQADSKPIPMSQVRSLHQALQRLLLPVTTYHYSETAIANLLFFAKLADEYHIICNTRIDDAIYVQSKNDNKYLLFQQDHKHNLHYIYINEANSDEHCYLDTVKEGKTIFSILDQKRVEAVRIFQERCGFLSDKDFIHTLECNFIEGVDFGRQDVNIANEIYGYSKGAAMGRFKHPRKGMKMDRTIKDIAAPVPPEIMKHYKDVHLDVDILFVNKTAFLLAISRDIGFIYCRPMSSSVTKRIQNAMKQITLDYQARGFNVATAFGNGAFRHLINWIRSELYINLTTYAANSHVPRAENAIRLVNERLRSIQCETLFRKYPKRLTIEMTKRATVRINSFRRISGVHSVMSLRQIIFGKKSKKPLCKMGELVLEYDVLSNNKTSKPRAFYALYIGLNDGGTGHSVFKLSTTK